LIGNENTRGGKRVRYGFIYNSGKGGDIWADANGLGETHKKKIEGVAKTTGERGEKEKKRMER